MAAREPRSLREQLIEMTAPTRRVRFIPRIVAFGARGVANDFN
jgi:hypothetical protein